MEKRITHDNNTKKHITWKAVLTVALWSGGIKFRWFPKGIGEGPSRPVNIHGLWSSDVTNFCNVAYPLRGFWRETVSLVDVMWPRSSQWQHALIRKKIDLKTFENFLTKSNSEVSSIQLPLITSFARQKLDFCRLLYKWSHSLWWVASKHVLKQVYSTLQ